MATQSNLNLVSGFDLVKSFTRTCLKALRTPIIFIDWRKHQASLKGGLLEMPEFGLYWRIHK